MSKLIEHNRLDLYRITSDLDIHINSKELWMDFYTNIENILNQNNMGYVYKIEKRRSELKGLDTSDSLTFSLIDSGVTIKFKIDMNIKSNNIVTVEYSPILNLNTYDALTMLSDKIVVISSEKIYRRIKDLYDLVVIVSLYNISYGELLKHIKNKHGNIKLNNMLITNNYEKICHAYSKYEGIQNKPDIRLLIAISSNFLKPIYNGYKGELIWNTQTSTWVSA